MPSPWLNKVQLMKIMLGLGRRRIINKKKENLLLLASYISSFLGIFGSSSIKFYYSLNYATSACFNRM